MNTKPEIVITLKNGNMTSQINAHRNVLITNDYFKNLLTGALKEKDTNEITLQVSNIDICKNIIMSFYGNPINYSSHKDILEYVKCCDYWLVPYENVLTDDLKIPEESFDLLLEIGELMNYSDLILKIIARNIPLEYDLSGIPTELKMRMINLNQIDCIVSASYDNTIKIWDLDTGAEIKTLIGHTNSVWSVCYIPEKNQIASGGYDSQIKIWDLNSGIEIKTLKGHTHGVTSVCYISDKNQIASGSFDLTIKIWDLNSGTVLKSLNGHFGWVSSICYIPEKNQIASGSIDKTIKIWNLESGIEINTLKWHTDSVFSVCYIPEKNQIVSGSDDGQIKIWDLNSGAVVKTFNEHKDWVRSIFYIPEKNIIVSGSNDKTIKIWDLDTGVARTLERHTEGVTSVCHIKMDSDIAKRLKN